MNMKGISRAEGDRVRGWYLRVYHGKKEYRKLFSDSKYGGKEAALSAAIAHRDNYLAENPPPKKRPFRTKLNPRNRTGVNGVYRTKAKSGNRKYTYDIYVAYYAPEPGVHKMKAFYVHNYPNAKACLQAAKEFRESKEIEMQQRWDDGNRGDGHGYYCQNGS